MKKLFLVQLIVLCLLSIITSVFASFDVPYYVYRADQLEMAVAYAKDMGLPIVFLYSNENTDCGLATSASLDVIEEFGSTTVMLYYDSGKNMPDIVRRAVSSTKSGKYIPKTVITDADLKKVLAIVPYIGDPKKRKAVLSELNSSIR